MDRQKVVLGFSGGVDSTAAAVILKNKGFEVIGLYFDVLPEGDSETGSMAKKTAEMIGISLRTCNVSKDFEKLVIGPFLDLYGRGYTPIPCVMCNPAVKFAVLKKTADELGAYYIATGHYARITTEAYTEPQLSSEAGGIGNSEVKCRYAVQKAVNLAKDQSYMLHRLPQEVLSRLLLPIGSFGSKDEIRAICSGLKLPNSQKKDSQDICFIKGCTTQEYLACHGVTGKMGNFVKTDGSVIKNHSGTANYTIGQRKGLGVALGSPAFVRSIDPQTGDIVLCSDVELYSNRLKAEDCYWQLDPPALGKTYTCKARYTAKEAPCRIIKLQDGGKTMELEFDEAQRAITPGQAAVIYDGNIVVGGGYISR